MANELDSSFMDPDAPPMSDSLPLATKEDIDAQYVQYYGELLSYCYHFIHNDDLKRDIAHEVLVGLYDYVGRTIDDPKKLMFKMARGLCLGNVAEGKERPISMEQMKENWGFEPRSSINVAQEVQENLDRTPEPAQQLNNSEQTLLALGTRIRMKQDDLVKHLRHLNDSRAPFGDLRYGVNSRAKSSWTWNFMFPARGH